jgi:hypothetical protein
MYYIPHQNLFTKTAHEIGHNLNADQPTNSGCLCGGNTYRESIMCQGGRNFQNPWFCNQSTTEMAMFCSNNSYKLSGSFFNTLNLSGTLTYPILYKANQTITSTEVINCGFASYTAGNQIVLLPGFHV